MNNEWIFVILIALVVIGGSQIPKLARNLGRAQNEFKAGLEEGKTATPVADPPPPAQAPVPPAQAPAPPAQAPPAAGPDEPPVV